MNQITFRKPMRKLNILNSHMEWQTGYRERLLKAIEDANISLTSSEFFKAGRYVTTCPDCFCPNMQAFYSEFNNEKGFCCPACGNSFSTKIEQSPTPAPEESR